MKRHPFDPVSFVFGVLFLGVGLPLMMSDTDFSFLDGTWMFPAFLIFAGVVILVTARGSKTSNDDLTEQPFD